MIAAIEEDKLRRDPAYLDICRTYTDKLLSPPAYLDKEIQTKAATKGDLTLEQYRKLSSEYIENETFRKIAFWIDVSHKMMRYEHADLTNHRIIVPTSTIYNLDGSETTYAEAAADLPSEYKVKFGSST